MLGDPTTWDNVKTKLPVGTQVTGAVAGIAPFGAFVTLQHDGIGLLRVPDMAGNGPKQVADYPQAGQAVTATVIGYDDGNRQVTLSQRA